MAFCSLQHPAAADAPVAWLRAGLAPHRPADARALQRAVGNHQGHGAPPLTLFRKHTMQQHRPLVRPPQPRPGHALHRLAAVALASLTTFTAGAAWAQDRYSDDLYFYGGLGGGQTRGVFDDPRITGQVATSNSTPFTNYSIATDRRDAGYKVFLGWQFNRYLGAELGYFNLGKYGFANTTVPDGVLTAEVRAQGANLDLVGSLPMTERLALLGRVGTVYARTRSEFTGSGAVLVTNPQPSRREANMKLGVGLQFAFTPGFMVRAEGEDYRVNDAAGSKGHVRLYSVSLVFPIGRSAPLASPVAMPRQEPTMAWTPAPTPVPAPAPAVVAVATPVPMAPALVQPVAVRRFSHSAESLFGFDSSTVGATGRAALDGLAAELDGSTYVTIRVEGFSDRIGTADYNQALSVRRAEAVKRYLVDSGRVDPLKISTVGLGEGTPVTKAGDCKGDTQSAALIACLQADRRVEIEVAGTR